ncbi:MAG: bifunctional riboflavin kinase/FAD synthetase [Chloroflexia bacterium]
MEVVQGWERLAIPGAVATIGVFDGVHLGHQVLIRGVVERARRLDVRAVAVTFHPHPRSIVAPHLPWEYICSLEERIARIADLGVDLLMILRFTPELAATSAEQFVADLIAHVPLRELHVGSGFVLGHAREGNLARLQALGQAWGFSVHAVSPVCVDGRPVSSTRIRELVQAGRVEEAERWLGRPFSLRGEVVAGEGRGRRLGFPTANLHLHPRQLLPGDGVYAVRVRFPAAAAQPDLYAGLAYVGRRPTFGGGERGVEVYLLEFNGSLLGYELRADFLRRLRPDRKFESTEALAEQMARDVEAARALLGQMTRQPQEG